ncbi:MAG: arginyltransferase [Alphaproteobacteria bacterium]|nr:arginyltransferase [Alphaproteobacteria bacterium]
MNQLPETPPVHFYKTPAMRCPYLADRQERLVFAHLRGDHADTLHNVLAQAGFRRSHNIVYRPDCDGCSACVPVRVLATGFRPTTSFRRILAHNRAVESVVLPTVASPEHFRQFSAYQAIRHSDGSMARMDFEEYRAMVEDSPVDTTVIEYRDPDYGLVGVALTDRLRDGLSMVYSFFNPAYERRSPGTFMILDHIERARRLGLPHVYLGYWISDSTKMAYKQKFRPLEWLSRTGWQLAANRPGDQALLNPPAAG